MLSSSCVTSQMPLLTLLSQRGSPSHLPTGIINVMSQEGNKKNHDAGNKHHCCYAVTQFPGNLNQIDKCNSAELLDLGVLPPRKASSRTMLM